VPADGGDLPRKVARPHQAPGGTANHRAICRDRRRISTPSPWGGGSVEASAVADLDRLPQNQEQPNQRARRAVPPNDPSMSPCPERSASSGSAVAPPAVQSGRRYQAAQDRAPEGADLQPHANGGPARGATELVDARSRAAGGSLWYAPWRDCRASLGVRWSREGAPRRPAKHPANQKPRAVQGT